MSTLSFTVYGLPAPQGSKRHVGNGIMVESSRHVATWREDVKQAALSALAQAPDWDREAHRVGLSVVFTFPRPRAHYRTGRHADQLREDAPFLHATTPDLDKILRATCDALATAGVFANDSRVASVVATKTYTHAGALAQPGAVVGLTNLDTWSPHA